MIFNWFNTQHKQIQKDNCFHNFNSCPFPYIYNKRCAIKEIIGSVMIVLIKKIINNLPMLTGIFEPSMTPPTSDKYINCDILSAPITKRVISFCTPSINIEGKTYRRNR